jgi:hypothetical protein
LKQGKRLTRKLLDRYCGPIIMKASLKFIDAPDLFHRLIYSDTLACEFKGIHGIYRTMLKIGDDELEASCTCPNDKPFCEHVAALGNTWIEVPESFQSVDELEPLIKNKSHDALVELMIKMILQNPGVLAVLGVRGFGPVQINDDGELYSIGDDDIFPIGYQEEDDGEEDVTEFTEDEDFEDEEYEDFYGEDYDR